MLHTLCMHGSETGDSLLIEEPSCFTLCMHGSEAGDSLLIEEPSCFTHYACMAVRQEIACS